MRVKRWLDFLMERDLLHKSWWDETPGVDLWKSVVMCVFVEPNDSFLIKCSGDEEVMVLHVFSFVCGHETTKRVVAAIASCGGVADKE